MSAGAVDVICSEKLPIGTKRLVSLLRKALSSDDFNPFTGPLYSQEGSVIAKDYDTLSPEKIIKMDWLAENVVGAIPSLDDLTDEAKPIVLLQGVKNAD